MRAVLGVGVSSRKCRSLIVIHRWGWTLVLNKDGTTTAWNPDRTKVLYSHSPPAHAG